VTLAHDVEAAIEDATATIDALDVAAWGQRCEAEGWPVAVTALHIALGLRRQASFIALALRGDPPFAFDWEATHALNARVAARGLPSKAFVRRELHKGRSRLMSQLGGLGEAGLQRLAMTYQEHPFDVERLVRRVVLPHLRGHLASIRAAVGQAV